jgi:hypothetical protein
LSQKETGETHDSRLKVTNLKCYTAFAAKHDSPPAAIAVNLKGVAADGAQSGPKTGGALHSAFPGLSDVDADKPFPGVAFNRMRRPGVQRTFYTLEYEYISRPFHAHKEPQQSTRFSPHRDNCSSQSNDETFNVAPLARVGACAPPAATLLRLTPMSGRFVAISRHNPFVPGNLIEAKPAY